MTNPEISGNIEQWDSQQRARQTNPISWTASWLHNRPPVHNCRVRRVHHKEQINKTGINVDDSKLK